MGMRIPKSSPSSLKITSPNTLMNGKSSSLKAKEYVGSKAQSLEILKREGFRVPVFISLPSKDCTEEVIESILKKHFSEVTSFTVRSSAKCEDGKEQSFAGRFY